MISAILAGRLLLAVVLAVAAVLLCTGLGDRFLWEDEAETALLARSVLVHGVPIARDGTNVISQICGRDADENYLWSLFPWLSIYLTAGSFQLLGVTTTAARLPFALLGVLAVASVYPLGVRLFRDRRLALVATVCLALSVTFLLHSRQSRYYALTTVAGAWMLYAFIGLVEGRRWALLGFVAASTVMFQAHHPIFVVTLASLVVAFVAIEFDRRALGRVAVAALAIAAINAPWLVVYRAGLAAARPADQASIVTAIFWGYLRKIDHYVVPLLALAVFAGWVLVEGRRAVWSTPAFRRALFLAAFTLAYVALLSVRPALWLRYVATLFPVFALLQAYVLCTLATRRPIVATAVGLVMLTTDVAHGWLSIPYPPPTGKALAVRSPLLQYVDELRHGFTGPIAALVRHLRTHARPGDRVYITYGDLPLRFHTDLAVRGGSTCEPTIANPPPDWVIVRHFFRPTDETPGLPDDLARQMRYVRDEIPWARYRGVRLPVVDTAWENIPELGKHHFVTPAFGPRVIIHERIRSR